MPGAGLCGGSGTHVVIIILQPDTSALLFLLPPTPPPGPPPPPSPSALHFLGRYSGTLILHHCPVFPRFNRLNKVKVLHFFRGRGGGEGERLVTLCRFNSLQNNQGLHNAVFRPILLPTLDTTSAYVCHILTHLHIPILNPCTVKEIKVTSKCHTPRSF